MRSLTNWSRKAVSTVAAAINEPATAEAIQRELVDSTDAVLAEAKAILERLAVQPKSDRAERLKRLGFTAAKEVVTAEEMERIAKANKRILALTEQHALKYPGFKFIDSDTMNAVCKKHGLVVGAVKRYMGDVPDWALDRIENCGVNTRVFNVHSYSRFGGSPTIHKSFEQEKDARDMVSGAELGGLCYYHESSILQIAAPKNEMFINENFERYEGNRIVSKDPIVCIPVDGGYCVICAWGEEGKDPRVFKADHN